MTKRIPHPHDPSPRTTKRTRASDNTGDSGRKREGKTIQVPISIAVCFFPQQHHLSSSPPLLFPHFRPRSQREGEKRVKGGGRGTFIHLISNSGRSRLRTTFPTLSSPKCKVFSFFFACRNASLPCSVSAPSPPDNKTVLCKEEALMRRCSFAGTRKVAEAAFYPPSRFYVFLSELTDRADRNRTTSRERRRYFDSSFREAM